MTSPDSRKTPSHRKGATSPATPAKIEAEERQRRAFDLRRGGADYDAIARELGYADHSGARLAVLAWMSKARAGSVADVESERALMAARLDRMLLDLWAARVRRVAEAPDPATGEARWRTEPEVGVFDRIVRIMERQARLLGLDAEDLRDDRRIELLQEQAEAIARALDEALIALDVPQEIRDRGRHVLAERLRVIEGEAVRLADRTG